MFTAHCVVCVFLAAFSFVVLGATDVCGEYPSGVLRGGDVDAHGPKYIYAAGKRQWQMRAILQSGQDTEEDLSDAASVQQDGGSPSLTDNSETKVADDQAKASVEARSTDQVKNQDGAEAENSGVRHDDKSASAPKKDAQEDTLTKDNDGKKTPDDKSSGDPSSHKGEQTIPVAEQPEGRRTDDASDSSKKQTAGGGGGGASQTEIKDQNAGGQGGQNGQSTTQPAGTGETKKKESTTTSTSQKTSESNTETTDFAALVRAPLVFFLLLAALACVCVC